MSRNLIVNGKSAATEALTVEDLLAELGYDPAGRGIAVAVGNEVVPRSRWSETALAADARVEIVGATQGG